MQVLGSGLRATVALAALLLLSAAPGARADHSIFEHASQGISGDPGTGNAFPVVFPGPGVSADGQRVLFLTGDQLTADDNNAREDIYERSGGTTSLVSTGPVDIPSPNPQSPTALFDNSSDLAHVLFRSDDGLVPEDTDGTTDLYVRSGGTTTLVPTKHAGPPVCSSGTFFGGQTRISDNGYAVVFHSLEPLVASDLDCETDLYVFAGGTLQLIADGPGRTAFVGMSSDGGRVFFWSPDSLDPADTDTSADYYEKSAGGITLVSIGPDGGNGPVDVTGTTRVTPDGDVYFETTESLVAADTDTTRDVYLRAGGTTELVSTGPAGGNGEFTAQLDDVSPDGSTAVFHTAESLVAADTDAQVDRYSHSGGVTRIVTTGPAGGNGPVDVAGGVEMSDDGSHVFFRTAESLVATDTDGVIDVYEYSNGTTTLASTSPSGGPTHNVNGFMASGDGSRLFFVAPSLDRLVGADTDSTPDVYERAGGATYLVSLGPDGGNGPFGVQLVGVSSDGGTVVLTTLESLMASDPDPIPTNTYFYDIYVVRRGGAPAPGYPRPKGATPLLASLVPAYRPCSSPTHEHGPPLAFGSCNPPTLESTQLTVGTADSNFQAAASVGSARYDAIAGNAATVEDEADVKLTFSLTDVRRQGTLTDYTGELRVSSTLRITDRMSGSGADPATSLDFDLAATIPCSATATAEGAACALATSFDALAPGSVTERRRSVWQLDQVRVHDGGPDGDADTAADNGLFAVEGVFVP